MCRNGSRQDWTGEGGKRGNLRCWSNPAHASQPPPPSACCSSGKSCKKKKKNNNGCSCRNLGFLIFFLWFFFFNFPIFSGPFGKRFRAGTAPASQPGWGWLGPSGDGWFSALSELCAQRTKICFWDGKKL